MPLYDYKAVANGLSTDHPIPGLPFTDDSHIPVHDGDAVEATGRHRGTGMWGRVDKARPRDRSGGWVAFTTDPRRHDLAWIVRWHPQHGRSVILYRDDDAAAVHSAFEDGPLLFRAGAYWWDGSTWFRPDQVADRPGEDYYHRPVPGAVTVTAADLLADGDGDASCGTLLTVEDIDPDTAYDGQWADDLALWASRRNGQDLASSIVTLTAPELAADRLAGLPEMAAIAGIAASTLRSYIARGEADVPLPQAVVGGRALWSRPVALDWAEQRQRSPEGLTETLASPGPGGHLVPVGEAETAAGLARSFYAALWEHRPYRSRWALRWRSPGAVREVAGALALDAAEYMLRSLVPLGDIGFILRHAVLDELAEQQRAERESTSSEKPLRVVGPDDPPASGSGFYVLPRQAGHVLDWLVRHRPATGEAVISAIIRDAEDRLGIPRKATEHAIGLALDMDGKLPEETLNEYLRRVLTPADERR